MKKEFTKEEVIKGSGCYSREQVCSLIENLTEPISIGTLLNLNLPVGIKDKRWFIYNSCELTVANKKLLALKLAWAVLHIYEEEYPNDSRVRDCLLQVTEDSYKGSITKKVLLQKKSAYAYTAATAATAAAAADAVTYAYTADAVAYAVAAATYAVAAADAVDRNKVLSYSERINNIFIEFFK